jgi:hypothetical protein
VNQGGQTLHRTVDQVGRDVANSFSWKIGLKKPT